MMSRNHEIVCDCLLCMCAQLYIIYMSIYRHDQFRFKTQSTAIFIVLYAGQAHRPFSHYHLYYNIHNRCVPTQVHYKYTVILYHSAPSPVQLFANPMIIIMRRWRVDSISHDVCPLAQCQSTRESYTHI